MGLTPKKIRDLTLSHPIQAGRASWVAAASGMVESSGRFFIVADDELGLFTFNKGAQEHGSYLPLFEGELPLGYEERKAEKPDFEALCELRHDHTLFPHNALLGVCSGSKKKRRRAALAYFDANKNISRIQLLDFKPLYKELKKEFEKLNIEGALVKDNKLLLFQRAKQKRPRNAIIRVKLDWDDLIASSSLRAFEIEEIKNFQLGERNGIPYGFTDACFYQSERILFIAAAEGTDDPTLDGEFVGARIGTLSSNLELESLHDLEVLQKPEGIAWAEEDKDSIYLVTDADDHSVPSQLFVLDSFGL